MRRFKVALVSISIIVSLLVPMLTLISAVEAKEESTIILQGKSTAYNEDLTEPPPWLWYRKGDLPPAMVAKKFGDGAVVAAGISATCRNGRWNNVSNPYPHLDVLLDVTFQWMKPGAKNVIWYEGYGVYNDTIQCSQLVAALTNLEYTIAPTKQEPIANINLRAFDILIIPQIQLGDAAPPGGIGPGDPNLLPDADVQAIKSFVEGGGGLLVMEGADFGFHNFCEVQNKILKPFGLGFGFQHDEIVDNDNPWGAPYELLIDVDDTTEIGAAYKAATGEKVIGLYGINSLAPIGPRVSVQIVPGYQADAPGSTLDYTVVIENPKTPTAENLTCSLAVKDNAGWGPTLSVNIIAVPVGENKTVTLSVTIPEDAEHCTRDSIQVTATSQEYPEISGSATGIAHAVTAIVSGVDVTISPSEDSGPPGTVLTYTVAVTNTGSTDDNYNLRVTDNAGWSLNISPSTLQLAAGESNIAILSVVIPVSAENCTRNSITVTATSIDNPEVSDGASCVAHAFGVAPARGVEVSISPTSKSGVPGETLTYYIEVKNVSADSFHLEVMDTKGWSSDLLVSSFWLSGAAGSSGKGILLNIKIPDNAAEGDSSTITVTALGTGYENHATCTATAKAAAFPTIYVIAAVVIVAVIVGAALIVKRT